VPTISERVFESIKRQPGISDAAMAKDLGLRHQQVNSEARHLENRGLIERRPDSATDGSIGNWPVSGEPPTTD